MAARTSLETTLVAAALSLAAFRRRPVLRAAAPCGSMA
jgi:hypothetical protein